MRWIREGTVTELQLFIYFIYFIYFIHFIYFIYQHPYSHSIPVGGVMRQFVVCQPPIKLTEEEKEDKKEDEEEEEEEEEDEDE